MQSSMLATIGSALQSAFDTGVHVDVETTTGRVFSNVSVGAVERFSIVLLNAATAHVVSREHIVSVSLEWEGSLQLPHSRDFAAAS